jgi:hypothetical protein
LWQWAMDVGLYLESQWLIYKETSTCMVYEDG